MGILLGSDIEKKPEIKTKNELDVPILKIDNISPNSDQPRNSFNKDSINELANSIKSQGLLMPILVKKNAKRINKYTIVAGERRWRACKLIGFKTIKAIIVENTTEKTDALAAIIENVQREDLSPLDEALAYEKLIKNYSMKHEDIAINTGKSRSYITNIIRILSLSPKVKKLLQEEKISFGHARALVGTSKQEVFADKVIEEKLNVRELEDLIRAKKSGVNDHNSKSNKHSIKKDPNILDYEKYLSLKLGYKVEIKNNMGKGYLKVTYKNLEQLDAIVELFNNQ